MELIIHTVQAEEEAVFICVALLRALFFFFAA